jgi:hypothetical protein
MTIKVELGFTDAGASAPFFTLDDPTLGLLDAPQAVLGGAEVLVDVSSFFRAFSTSRGKSRELDKFQAGQATVSFNNNDRTFDPTFAASPYFGQIQPRRQVRITVDTEIVYEGTIDDWNIEYEAGGNSVATLQAFDGFANLANLAAPAITLSEGFTDDQIIAVLDGIQWPASKRSIDVGGATLTGQTLNPDANALAIMQRMADSEPGDLFIAKNGDVKFVGRNASFSSGGVILADDGSEISYQNVKVVFGSELLYNSIIVRNLTTEEQATSSTSIGLYGERDLTRDTFLADATDLETLANVLVQKYQDPEYRFQALEVNLRTIDPAQRADLLALELGDVVEVQFTPGGIAPAIERYGKIIRLTQAADSNFEVLGIGLEAIEGALFVLDDVEFGKLNVGVLGW